MMSLLIAFTFIIKTSGNNRDHCENQKEHLSLHFAPEKYDENTEERASF